MDLVNFQMNPGDTSIRIWYGYAQSDSGKIVEMIRNNNEWKGQ